ncbi:response regulator [Pseudoalteromonas luteoviolacea]|uniref:Response regulatory domain-containing protein n=1 Tax=Pseudoalteromonas luteoviolacea DSM 6061 TaxID=1365250 RepID=A0A166XUG6_9GAMM|nr:response regulator [Pseudoalteromonas luteoviolacea]KZN40919.1 hypothetical protein N475_00665 [Pseudoalteromonas luteoviolacea DSM 6061]KZN56457.1 hypothetical protein N474_11970 [Pseudoalteromonas luteoviolacea CPMOR-2]MBE0386364.1 hypothetical protein [Pseudoalteromonas luteoviolacea DSM 6061]TQF71239.1 response regulator [Pseudoalteromonas luteoviolacea]
MNPISILIVDDSEDDRYILIRQLRQTQIPISEIFECTEGVSALNFFVNYKENMAKYPDAYPPNFIFLDINMPLMDGFEFLTEFKKLKADCNFDPIVIMFSSSERQEDLDRVKVHPVVKAYIVKGRYDVAQLKNQLKPFLGAHFNS